MNASDTVDVLVIGAGASGGAFTWSLSEAGIQVMCLEQGGWVEPTAYPTAQDDWELHRLTDYNPDPNLRGLPEDYPVNDSDSPIAPLMYNAGGGSTIHWSAHFPRLHPSDFRVKTLDGVADDWPVNYAQLEPFFDLNDRMVGVSGITGDPAYPPKSERQTPPVPLGDLGNTIVGGFEKLGWHWWPSDSAIITRAYDGRAPCNNCGPCDIGCYQRAKASSDVTYWPKAVQKRRHSEDARQGEGDHGGEGWAGGRRGLLRPGRPRPGAEGAGSRPGLQRGWDAANAAELGVASVPGRSGQQQRAGGQKPDVPPVRDHHRRLRRPAGRVQGADRVLDSQPGVLRDRPGARLCKRLQLPDREELGSCPYGYRRRGRASRSVGRGPPPRFRRALRQDHHTGRHRGRSSRAEQPGIARPRPERQRRHSGAEDQLHAEREQQEAPRPRSSPCDRCAGGGRARRMCW